MKRLIEKILERLILESSSCKVYKLIKPNIEDVAEFNAYKKCIEIVKEVAEDYKDKPNIIDGLKIFLQEKFNYCAEQAEMNLEAECNSEIASYFRNRKELYLDRANIYGEVMREIDRLAEEYNGGWIPCSERLPDDDKNEYIVQKTNGFIDILGFTKDAYKLDRYDFAEYKGKKKQLFYDYDSEYGYTEWECEAWQPLPKPFRERD